MHAVFGLAFLESCCIFHKKHQLNWESPSKTDASLHHRPKQTPCRGGCPTNGTGCPERLLVTLYLLVSVQRSLERIGTYRPQTRLMGLPCMPINVGWCQGVHGSPMAVLWQSMGRVVHDPCVTTKTTAARPYEVITSK